MDESAAGPAPRPWRSAVPLKVKAALALLFGGVLGLSLYTASYAEGLSYLSDDPASCRNCHVMNDVHDAWAKGPHRAVATCNDCHTPHAFPDKYVVKAISGWNHSVAFTLQSFEEPIRITPSNKNVVLNNCSSCHGEAMSLVDHAGQAELTDCTRCHAAVGHDAIGVGRP